MTPKCQPHRINACTSSLTLNTFLFFFSNLFIISHRWWRALPYRSLVTIETITHNALFFFCTRHNSWKVRSYFMNTDVPSFSTVSLTRVRALWTELQPLMLRYYGAWMQLPHNEVAALTPDPRRAASKFPESESTQCRFLFPSRSRA